MGLLTNQREKSPACIHWYLSSYSSKKTIWIL